MVRLQNVIKHSWEGNFLFLNKIPESTINLLNDDFKRYKRYLWLRSLFESRVTFRLKHPCEEQTRAYRILQTKVLNKYLANF